MVVWAVVIPIFWAVTAHNVRHGSFGQQLGRARFSRFLYDSQPVLIALSFVTAAALITERFWGYWSTLI